ncbi:MAG: VOC family protein [Novosphingobium sp.]|nr:VOC family protein [Novosphingobium sp.]
MVAMPLAHVSWALLNNADRPACDAFFMDVFGAESVFEMLMAQLAGSGFDREERLMVIGNTMLIPIAPAGPGEHPDSPIGGMLRRNAVRGRWLGVSLRVADLKAADAWFRARGFRLHYDPGVEDKYFLIGPRQVMGMRIEVMTGELPNDPRVRPGWHPEKWRDEHPLGIEGLQSIGVSVSDLEEARDLFAGRLDWPGVSVRSLEGDDADCAAFGMGDAVIEAMQPRSSDSALAQHVRDVQGIYCLTFKVRSAEAAADYLRRLGLNLIGELDDRFAIAPDQAWGRLIYFTENTVEGYPALGSKLTQPAEFPA